MWERDRKFGWSHCQIKVAVFASEKLKAYADARRNRTVFQHVDIEFTLGCSLNTACVALKSFHEREGYISGNITSYSLSMGDKTGDKAVESG